MAAQAPPRAKPTKIVLEMGTCQKLLRCQVFVRRMKLGSLQFSVGNERNILDCARLLASSCYLLDRKWWKISLALSKLTIPRRREDWWKWRELFPENWLGSGGIWVAGALLAEKAAEQAEPNSLVRKRGKRKAIAGWEGAPAAAPLPTTFDPAMAIAICWEVGHTCQT